MFWVWDPATISVQDVYCFPNPATDRTTFTFNPVNSGGGADIIIEISNLSGVIVRTITTSIPESSGILPEIPWNLTDAGGNKLSSGLYPFVIRFRANNGAYSQTAGKIVIIR